MKKLIWLLALILCGCGHAGIFDLEDTAGPPSPPPPRAATQAEMESGTEAGLRSVSPLRVAQSVNALAGAGATEVVDAAVAAAGNTDTTHTYSKDDIHDYVIQLDTDLDGDIDTIDTTVWATKQDVLTNPLLQADVDDTPVNGVTTAPVSSNWAYDHTAAVDPHTGYMLESNIGTGASNYLQLSANPGTPDGTKFMRDDRTWVVPSGGAAEVQDEIFNATNFDGGTTAGVSQDDFYDRFHLFDADDDGDFTDEAWFPSTSGAPTAASYLTGTAEAGLSAEVNLGALTTGLLKITVSGGVATPSTAAAGTDFVGVGGALGTPSSGTLTNCTFPTLNQNTTGTAAGLSGTPNITVGTISAGAAGFAVDADGDTTVKSVTSTKSSGVAGRVAMYEANTTDTHTAGFRGPASITGDGAYEGQLPNARPSSANMVLAFTNAGESGTGTAADPYVQATSWLDLDSYQAASANLTTWAGVTPGTGVATAAAAAVNGTGGFVTYGQSVFYSATPVIDDPDNFSANFTGANLYGGTFIANAAGTAALPDPVAGMNFTYVLEGANANIIDPLTTGTADTIVMNGLAAAQDENITSSTSGAICYFQYRAANSWMATCVDFAEATP